MATSTEVFWNVIIPEIDEKYFTSTTSDSKDYKKIVNDNLLKIHALWNHDRMYCSDERVKPYFEDLHIAFSKLKESLIDSVSTHFSIQILRDLYNKICDSEEYCCICKRKISTVDAVLIRKKSQFIESNTVKRVRLFVHACPTHKGILVEYLRTYKFINEQQLRITKR